jgi:hypothetical protein
MAKKEENYDKVLLGLAAVAALGVSGYLFMIKGDVGSHFTSRSPAQGTELGVIPTESVQRAQKRLLEAFSWDAPSRNGKEVPLNKSVLILLKGTELYDMFLEDKPLRPPMTNAYLRDNELLYLAPNVGELDPDEDGFSNEEEFLAKTSPKNGNQSDPKAMPPLKSKIYFVAREQDDYKLVLNSSGSPVQLKRTAPNPQRTIFVSTYPYEFSFEPGVAARFVAKSFAAKKVPDPRLGEKDVSELTILDRANNTEVVLVLKQEVNLATYKAKLQFRWKTVQDRVVKKGDSFTFEGVPTVFRLEDVTETGAKLSEQKADGSFGEPWNVTPPQ